MITQTTLKETSDLFTFFSADEAQKILYQQLTIAASSDELETEERAAAFKLHSKLSVLLMALENEYRT
jgi:acyl carrier protein